MTCEPSDVKAITGSALDDAVIAPFITAATIMLLGIEESWEATEAQFDAACQFLAAHLLTSSVVGQTSSIISKEALEGKYSVEYLRPAMTKSGILGTSFGQAANAMTSGNLAQLDKAPIRFLSIGDLG